MLRSFSKVTHSWWGSRTRSQPTVWIWSPALSQDVTLIVKEVLFSVFKSIMDGLIFVKRNSPREKKKTKALVITKVPRH